MATTPKPKSKISSFFDAFSNPGGGLTAAPLSSLVAPLLPTAKPLSNVPSKYQSPTPYGPAPLAPNMSTEQGPRYAPPPSTPAAQTASAPAPAPTLFRAPAGGGSPGGSSGGAPAAPATPAAPVPPQWLNPDGSFKSPDQVAADAAAAMKAAHGNGDIGNLALDQFGDQSKKTAAELEAEARRIGNTRNDIAVGEKDPYRVASSSGIAYTPGELAAIEKAYAGVYDPALDTALAKVTERQQSDAAAAKAAADASAPFTLGKDQVRYDGQGNPIAVGISGDTAGVGGTYVRGANPTVDAYVAGFRSGTYKASDIPDEYKSLVAQGVAATKPSVSKSSNDAISVIDEIAASPLLEQIAGVPNVATFLPGTQVQTVLNLTKQLKGLLSLENRTQLKGSGAISDFEFRVLGDASSALGIGAGGRTNLSKEEFQKQLAKLRLKLSVGETGLTDDELLFLSGKGYTPDQIREYDSQSSFSDVGNTTASTANRPQRNNNPGNLKSGGLADSLATGTDDQGHLVFPDAATGLRALAADLTAKVNGASQHLPANPTIAQLGKVYAEDPNWPVKVAAMLGVPVGTHTQLVPIDQLAKAVATQEGFYA